MMRRPFLNRRRTGLVRPPAGNSWRARLAEADRQAGIEFTESRAPSYWRGARAVRRVILIGLWTFLCIPLQAVCVAIGGRAAILGALWYHAVLCAICGFRIRLVGDAARPTPGRPVLFLSNHQSWADILVLGGVLEACFVAKAEVGTWPLIRTVARLGRTVFVSRRRNETGRERDEMVGRLRSGDSLILFPEGTTSDGARVLPFRSALLGAAEVEGVNPIIQPVSIVFDRLDGLPIGRKDRPLFAWYGDMEIGRHAWALLGHRSCRATIVLHPPLDPAVFGSRKAVAEAAWQVVDASGAALRQGRPPVPLTPRRAGGPAPAMDERAA